MQLGDPLERVVLALEGDEDAVGGGERVQGEEAEARGAVDEDVVVLADDGRERLFQPVLAGHDAHELDLGPGQVAVGGHERQVLEVGRHHELGERSLLDERLVEARPGLAGLAAEAGGQVALGVGVHGEDPPLGGGQARGEVDRRRGLADPALLVGDRDGASHWSFVRLAPESGQHSTRPSTLTLGRPAPRQP